MIGPHSGSPEFCPSTKRPVHRPAIIANKLALDVQLVCVVGCDLGAINPRSINWLSVLLNRWSTARIGWLGRHQRSYHASEHQLCILLNILCSNCRWHVLLVCPLLLVRMTSRMLREKLKTIGSSESCVGSQSSGWSCTIIQGRWRSLGQ